jgi:hypothetical protein
VTPEGVINRRLIARRVGGTGAGRDALDDPSGVVRQEPKLRADEDDRARAAGLDDLTSRRQHSICLVDPERHDRVGVLLVAEALVGVGRIEDLVCWIEAKKARGLRVGRRPAQRS